MNLASITPHFIQTVYISLADLGIRCIAPSAFSKCLAMDTGSVIVSALFFTDGGCKDMLTQGTCGEGDLFVGLGSSDSFSVTD